MEKLFARVKNVCSEPRAEGQVRRQQAQGRRPTKCLLQSGRRSSVLRWWGEASPVLAGGAGLLLLAQVGRRRGS